LLAIGQPVQVTFDAYPNEILDGSITLIEPALNTFEGSSVAVVWAELNAPVDMPLMSGMSADVEVIAAETRDALLVPIQALREISPGSYSVFVVQPDGSLRMVIVTVGLQDYANAEILSGLEQGDIISTGSVETK
jgi:multidrug efflux pump subunit AcrA (membrane-fusion protein)